VWIPKSVLNADLNVCRKGVSRANSRAMALETEHRGATIVAAPVVGRDSAGYRALDTAFSRRYDRDGDGHYINITKKLADIPDTNLLYDRAGQRCLGSSLMQIEEEEAEAKRIAAIPERPLSERYCGGCKMKGHSFGTCLWTTDSGDFDGCPFCEETGGHLPENCHDRSEFSEDDIWKLFVMNRRGKSQIRTLDRTLAWPYLVFRRAQTHQNEVPTEFFPLTPAFAKDWFYKVPNRCTTHDYKNEPLTLPCDPSTQQLMTVLVKHEELSRPYPYDGVSPPGPENPAGGDADMPDKLDIEQEGPVQGRPDWGEEMLQY
jgi:hypothetical protein